MPYSIKNGSDSKTIRAHAFDCAREDETEEHNYANLTRNSPSNFAWSHIKPGSAELEPNLKAGQMLVIRFSRVRREARRVVWLRPFGVRRRFVDPNARAQQSRRSTTIIDRNKKKKLSGPQSAGESDVRTNAAARTNL